jgi:adenine-specific DNA-methyltransferase
MPILHWLDRDKHVRQAEDVPYRLLEADDALAAGDPDTPNMLVQGDNLDALKALVPYYAGRVKCVYIDPPFNTGQAFKNYDDNLEHSTWLGMLYPRLKLLHILLSEEGTIAIHLDSEELAYCIVMLDEIFGRPNRVNICTFKQGAAVGHKAINPGLVTITNYLIIYAKSKNEWRPKRIFTSRERDKRYSSFISNFEEAYEHWQLEPLAKAFASQYGEKHHQTKKRMSVDLYEDELSAFVIDNAHRIVQPVPLITMVLDKKHGL